MSTEIDIIIIGAGVVGLAHCCEVSSTNKNGLFFEKKPYFRLERAAESEVSHAGMDYPEDSLKAKFV